MINFNEMEKKYGKNNFVFFQRQMSSSREERTFVIGLPSQKKGLVLTVNCYERKHYVKEILSQIDKYRFKVSDPLIQFDTFGVGFRYFRILYARNIDGGTLPEAIGTDLCSAVNA